MQEPQPTNPIQTNKSKTYEDDQITQRNLYTNITRVEKSGQGHSYRPRLTEYLFGYVREYKGNQRRRTTKNRRRNWLHM
jgi:hypothetical protein